MGNVGGWMMDGGFWFRLTLNDERSRWLEVGDLHGALYTTYVYPLVGVLSETEGFTEYCLWRRCWMVE